MEKKVQESVLLNCLQIVSVFVWSISLQFGYVTFWLLTLYICFFTNYWYLIPLVICWNLYDRERPYKGGRSLWIIRNFPTYKYFNGYFPIRLVKTADLDRTKNYLFCVFPHGFVGVSNMGNFLNGYSTAKELFPGLKFHTAVMDVNFRGPILRDIVLGYGLVSSTSRSLKYLLKEDQKGNAVILFVGGTDEVKYATSEYKIVLKKRKGFIKTALTSGCSLVPVFSFGETKLFENEMTPTPEGIMGRFSKWVRQKNGVHICLPIGRTDLFKFLPKRQPINTVVGKPICLPKLSDPTQEDVDHYHSLFTEELIRLFNEHKHNYCQDPSKAELIIAE